MFAKKEIQSGKAKGYVWLSLLASFPSLSVCEERYTGRPRTTVGTKRNKTKLFSYVIIAGLRRESVDRSREIN